MKASITLEVAAAVMSRPGSALSIRAREAPMARPDLVLIPIGGHFVMHPADAAMAVRDMIKPKFAIPIHYGTTPVLRGTPAEVNAALGSAPGMPRMLSLEPGQKFDY